MKAVLAIDQSTSGTKALLFDLQGKLLDQASLVHQQHYPQPGWVEHDAEEIYTNTLQATQIVLERNPMLKDHLCHISLTNQRETVVVFEKSNGRPLYHAIVWQCRRGTPFCEELVKAGYSDLIQQRTGLKIDTYFSASKLHWLVDQYPEIGRKLQEGSALAGTIDAYLIYRMTQGKSFSTDSTNASRTLLYNIDRLGWDEELCKLFRVPVQALPEVRESSSYYGETTLEGILKRPLPIYGVMGDSQASLFAQRCFTPGTAKVTFGTGSSLLMNIGQRLRLSASGIVSTIAWVQGGRVTYCFEGIINFSAATIAWLKDQLKLIANAAETEALALEVEDNGGVYLVPAFVGLSAPYWAPNARAAIVGLTSHSSKNHVVRAALESIAYQIKDVLELMVSEAGIPLQAIHADGGAVRNRFLMQFVADMTGYPVRVAELPELSALGAVYAGLLGTGMVDSLAAINELPRQFTVYQPAMPGDQVNTLYAGWKAAVQRVL